MIPYILFWLIAAAVAVCSVWLYRKGARRACIITAALPMAGALALFVTLMHDYRLPHTDGVAVTAVMRWFMLDDNVHLWQTRGTITAVVLLAATVLFFVLMTALAWRNKRNA